jgi:hypothetical protein
MTRTDTTATATECLTCQIETMRQTGIEITESERNHSMLWGCTCTVEQLQARYAKLGRLFDEAKGDHPALAAVRSLIAASMDSTEYLLSLQGVEISE